MTLAAPPRLAAPMRAPAARQRAVRTPVPFGRWLLLTFLAFVALPSIGYAVYLAAFKTPLYESEARFSVRSGSQESGVAPSGALTSLIAKAGISGKGSDRDDLYAIQNFLLSDNAIEAVGGVARLEAVYGGASVDPLSRMRAGLPVEDALTYWRRKVHVYVDGTSGILTLNVGAFESAEALKLANDLVHASETFLNELTRRGRAVALDDAELQLKQSASDMAAARAKLLDYQSTSGILDPVETVKQLGELIGQLRLSQLQVEGMIDVGEIVGTDKPVRQAERQAQVDIIQNQIASLEAELTGGADRASVATMLREYEGLKVDEEFTTEVYRLNRSAYEKARRQLEQQQRFVVSVVKPIAGEEPTEPTPLASSATAFGALFVLWGIVMLVVAAIRDR